METLVRTHPALESLILEYRNQYDTPEKSSGKCLHLTNVILDSLGYVMDLGIAFACSTGDIANVERRYYSNHFAIMMDINGRQMVIDFTLRQFDPNASYPAILTIEEWAKVLSIPWNGFINVETGYEICGCYQGVEGSCGCSAFEEVLVDG